MPYDVRKSSGCPASRPWALINKVTGETVACHGTRAGAERQRAAILANEKGGSMQIHTKQVPVQVKALGDGEGGEFEALVSVYGNVDLVGDRVVDGAFAKSLASWREKGDPIPVVLAHDWDNPWSHIGYADPADVEEVPGVGLRAKRAHLDVADNPVAAQVYRLMKRKSMTNFSFGYRPVKEARGKDGANDLMEIDLIEFGPCLKGVNPAAGLLAIKAAEAVEESPSSLEKVLAEMREEIRQLREDMAKQVERTVEEPVVKTDDADQELRAYEEQIAALRGGEGE